MSDFTTHFITAHKFLSKGNFSKDFERAFYFGVQGPDLFFYRTPLSPGEGMKFGSFVHNKIPAHLFEEDANDIENFSDEYSGYYFGVMLHYFGDRQMHQYIGHLTKTDPRRFAHIMFERDIDVLAYEDYFKKPIKTFDVKEFYRYSPSLNQAILEYWTKRETHPLITFKDIKKCMQNITNYAVFFSKPHKILVPILKFFEGKKYGGIFSGHIKHTYNKEVMNYGNMEWMTPVGMTNRSVWDFLNLSVSEFENEREKILELPKRSTEYKFEYNETFSYGCKD